MTSGSVRKMIFSVFAIVILLTAGCNTVGQQMRQDERRQAKTQRDIEKRKAEREKVYQEQASRQKKMQTKETQRRMKELERKSKRWRKGKGDPFYEQWIQRLQERRNERQQRRQD